VSGTPARERIESLFESALELDDAQRAEFVAAACGGDAAMRDAVMALLAAHARAEGVLEGDPQALMERSRLPQRLGPYRVLREVGRGGMGIVYDAERDDGQFRRRVAIKIIHSADDELQRRVLAERQILAALDHPHIARLLDGGVADDGRPYLVMEYVEGMPVDVYCDRMRLGVTERLRLFVTVARTVDFAHRNLIVHRDLKPSNVMVTPDGTVKLLDFGVAKLLNRSLGGESVAATRDRAALTPEYASPEQIQGGALTTTTDVYSLGVMLYELLCGRRPFAHLEHDMAAFMGAVCHDDIDRPSVRALREETLAREGTTLVPVQVAHARDTTPQRLARRLRGDCDAIVAAALRAEPPRRYASAEALAQDIERHLAERPVRAYQGSRAYRFGKLIRRHRAQFTAILLGAAALLVGTSVAVWQATAAHVERMRAEAALAQSEQVTEFLIDLFESGDPAQSVSSGITARDLVRRGTARIDGLADQPLLQARMLGVLGRIHESLGSYDEGQRLTARALDLRRSRGLAQEPETAELIMQLGVFQRRRDEFDSAQASFTLAREILQQAPGAPHPALSRVMQQLASIAIYRGDLFEAERRAAEAVDLLRRQHGESDRATVTALRYLGAVQWRLGRYADAEQNIRRAIELRPSASGSTREEGFNDRLQLAALLNTMRRLDEAERIFTEAYREMRADIPEDINFMVWSLGGRANIAEARGDLVRALELRRQLVTLRQSTLGDGHPSVATGKAHIAYTLAKLGEFEDAEGLMDEARRVVLDVYGEHSTAWSGLLAEYAQLRIAQQRYDDAESYLQQALSIQRERSLQTTGPYVERLIMLADVQTALRRFARAEELLNEALERSSAMVAPGAALIRQVHEAFERLYAAWDRPADAARHRRSAETTHPS
jgi:eukaryotic-like serine/threonine-protein kinase